MKQIYYVDREDLTLSETELSARLGIPAGQSLSQSESSHSEIKRTMTPMYAYRRVRVERSGDIVILDDIKVCSSALARVLKGCTEAIILLCTLGAGVDRLLTRKAMGSVYEEHLADSYASAYADALGDYAIDKITAGEAHTALFGVGYADFNIEYQRQILGYDGLGISLGVSLTESCLMLPTKSICAVVGVKK